MQLRYNFRLHPTQGQERSLACAFGCARVVYNDALAARKNAYEAGRHITDAELSRALTAAKKTPERAWLTDVSSVVLQQALADLNVAYRSFFDSVKGNVKVRESQHRGSGHAGTIGSRFGSPAMLDSQSQPVANYDCLRLVMSGWCGHDSYRRSLRR